MTAPTRTPPSVRATLALLLGGSLAGQAMAAASTPLITRLYAPERLGEVAVFSAVLTAGAVVATLGYEKAIPLPVDDDDGARLVEMSLLLAAPGALVLAAGSMLLFAELRGAVVAVLLVTGLYAVAVFNTGLGWAIRANKLTEIARTRALQGAGQAVLQVAGGALTRGSFLALGVGIVAARCLGAMSLLGDWRSRSPAQQARAGRTRLAARYRQFAFFSMPGSLANALSLLLPPVLIAVEYGTERSGLFVISSRLAMLPAIIASGALTPAYLEQISRQRRDGEVAKSRKTFVAYTSRLLVMGTVATVGMIATARWSGALLGASWSAVEDDLYRLLPIVLLQPAASTISQTLNALEQNRTQFLWEASRLALMTAAVLAGARLGLTSLGAVTAVGAVLAMSYLVVIGLSWQALQTATPCREVLAR